MAMDIQSQAPQKKLRTMAQIFTSKGKGSNKEAMSIDFAPPEKEQCLCSVDFAPKPPQQATTAPPATRKTATAPKLPTVPLIDPDGYIESVRVRDRDLDPALYDSETGEYFQRPPPAPRRHKQAVDAALSALRGRMG